MTPQEITEANKLIAEFMGEEIFWEKTAQNPDGNWHLMTLGHQGYIPLKYHSSWDWLMPVIRKAKQSRNSAEWGWNVLNLYLSRCEIEYVFPEVVEFIKWHNQNKAQ